MQEISEAVLLSDIGSRDLPPNVTTNKQEFIAKNASSSELYVEERSGEALLIYLNMEGAQGEPVRVVFDTGAGVCLWTQQTILQGYTVRLKNTRRYWGSNGIHTMCC